MKGQRLVSATACALLLGASGLLLATRGVAASETITIVFDDANGFRPPVANVPYSGSVRWTNSGGLRVQIRSLSGPCNFNISVDPFSTSSAAGPYTTPGRCAYKGDTLLGTSMATLVFAPPSPKPTRSPKPTKSPKPTPSATAKPSGQPTSTTSPTAKATSTPRLSQSPSPAPDTVVPLPTPEPTVSMSPSPSPCATNSSQSCSGVVISFNVPDSGRRTLGLPAALAAVLLAAVVGAIARVLSAEARAESSSRLGDRPGVR